MKKLLSLLLVLVMLFSVAACGNNTNVRDEITNDIPDVEQEQIKDPEPEFSLGKTVGNTYENPFIGLGIALDDNWEFYTDEQIMELNNIATDLLDDEYKERLQDADLVYDMFAQSTDSYSNMNVILEKHNDIDYDEKDLLAMLENSLPELENALVSMGFQDIKSSDTLITEIGNERFPSAKIHSTIGETDFYQLQLYKNIGEYYAIITLSSFDETILNNTLEQFYIID